MPSPGRAAEGAGHLSPGLYFPAVLKLERQTLKAGQRNVPLQPGMSLTADVFLRERRFISTITGALEKRLRSLEDALMRGKAHQPEASFDQVATTAQQRRPHPSALVLPPQEQRSRQALFQLRRRRLWAGLKQKRQRIGLVVIVYLLIWSIPVLAGEPLLSAFALLPLVLVPPVGYLVYWLVWNEFHA